MKRFLSILILLSMVTLMCSAESAGNGTEKGYTKHSIGISDSSAAFREALFAAENVLGNTPEQQLASYEEDMRKFSLRTVQLFPEFDNIHEITAYQDRVDVFTLEAENYECIVYYIHGGAWTAEISVPQASFCDKLADTLNAKVVIPLYPLAPQADYQETYAMLEEVYELVAAEGKPVIVMGDSAGGTCTLGLVLRRKAAGKSLPEKVIAIAPCADMTFTNPEIDEIAKLDGMLPKYYCLECAKLWTNGDCLTDPSVSPLNGDFAGFPDTMVIVGDHDLLYADDLLLADKMAEAGVDVTLLVGEGFWHVFPVFSIAEAGACRELIRVFVEE